MTWFGKWFRRRKPAEVVEWAPTGIKWDTHKHDEAKAVNSAERAKRLDISRRKLHALRSVPQDEKRDQATVTPMRARGNR